MFCLRMNVLTFSPTSRVWLSEDVIFADHVSYQISQINQSSTAAMPGMCRVIALVDEWQRIPKQICQIMIYYLKWTFYVLLQGNIISIQSNGLFSRRTSFWKHQINVSADYMWYICTNLIFPTTPDQFCGRSAVSDQRTRARLLLTVMKYMFKKKHAH